MNDVCLQEPYVRHAAAENNWSESLRNHVAACVHCRAAAAVAPVMAAVAKVQPQVLPSPAVIWLKAQLMRRERVQSRMSLPLDLMQLVAYLAVAAGWTAVLTTQWNDLQRFATSPGAVLSGSATVSLTLMAAVVVLGSMTFALAMHTILAEE